jgi:putative FmdB family regulatory protein
MLPCVPTYDFRCVACGLAFEANVDVSARAACPQCGTAEAQRLYRPIAPPAGTGLRGYAARQSNARRHDREERRWEGFRKQREQIGLPPREPRKDS